MTGQFITLEEHFFSQAMMTSSSGSSYRYSEQFKHIPMLKEKLSDVGTIRLSSMDANSISMQVVSHGPGSMTADECRSANDQLQGLIEVHRDRFAGFAVLPVADPVEAARELKRCVTQLGFVGALIDNHTDSGGFFDGDDYHRTLWQAAVDLDVPVYLHPTWATDAHLSTLYGDKDTNTTVSAAAVKSISASAFGWHSLVATHVLRLFASGLFDRFPALKLILGHMGEMLPFMLQRITVLSKRWGPRDRSFDTVWNENIWITTSGNWSVDPMACILRNTKIDHILYSVDYPFGSNEDGTAFMNELRDSGLVDQDAWERIAWRNAEALLRVKRRQEGVEEGEGEGR